MSNADKAIGANVRALRELRGWSQGAMARRMTDAGLDGIHQTTLSRIEVGERSLRLTEAAAAARALGVDVRHLLSSGVLPDPEWQQSIDRLRRARYEHHLAAEELARALSGVEQLLSTLPPGSTRDLVEQALNPKETP